MKGQNNNNNNNNNNKKNNNKTVKVASLECVSFYIENVNVYLNFEFYKYFS